MPCSKDESLGACGSVCDVEDLAFGLYNSWAGYPYTYNHPYSRAELQIYKFLMPRPAVKFGSVDAYVNYVKDNCPRGKIEKLGDLGVRIGLHPCGYWKEPVADDDRLCEAFTAKERNKWHYEFPDTEVDQCPFYDEHKGKVKFGSFACKKCLKKIEDSTNEVTPFTVEDVSDARVRTYNIMMGRRG